MLKLVGAFGPNLPPLTFHQLREPLLKKEKNYTEDLMQPHKEVWAKKGCSFMSDGWTDRKEMTLINFLVNSPHGTVFLSSIDASDEIKTGARMFEILNEEIKKIGPENVVQIVTDNHASLKLAGKYLMDEYPHMYWTPCAAHCLNLILKDIGKLPFMKMTLSRAMELTGFIYSHGWVLRLMREQINARELLRPATTRFASSFLTLSSIHKQKNNLRKMFCSEKWVENKRARDPKGKAAERTVKMTNFWNNVVRVLKLTGPLVRVLKLVDNERKPTMEFIYEAMDRAKEAIAKAFGDDASKYSEVFEMIDKRWNVQLHHPLHAAGFYLNPIFFYAHPNIQADKEIMKGLWEVIQKLVPEQDQDKISQELTLYKEAQDLFGMPIAIRNREKKSPADWWDSYGAAAPILQKLTIRILSLTCSSSGCERNWSTFEQIHTKKRNRLDHNRLQDLVFCKYNQALKERFDCRDIVDPIKLTDIDESNEWLLGQFGEGDNAENDLVDEEDDLRWGVVGEATGVEENWGPNLRSTATARVRGSSSGIASSSRRREPDSEDEDEFNEEEEETEDEEPLQLDDDDDDEDD
ncbi:uncharacterized protein LOC109841094 [Asparagus officinalis]|uniref:uncharacterized protein LOC109841094 n=1 Tax=Asparagus officinalis TaxID=4686 RepID=UPI00098E0C6B|nr:uncharacterized protein LOC109841094 [Asparagus officinalis]